MALTNTQKINNLKTSIDYYIQSQLGSTYSIDYDGVPHDETQVNEWIQPRIIYITADIAGRGGNNALAQETQILLQFNIFVKIGAIEYSDRIFTIRDDLINYFKIGQDIWVYDFDGNPDAGDRIDKMRVRDVVDDMEITGEGIQNDLKQYVLSFEMSYTRCQ
jgi:hypothetical protein